MATVTAKAEPASRREPLAEETEAAAPRRRSGAGRWMSPLTARILAVNVLALALLVAGLLYLGRYQDRLIQQELQALATEARIYAGALAEGAVVRNPRDERNVLSADLARQMVRRFVETTDTRTRLFAADGDLVADSRYLVGRAGQYSRELLPPWNEDLGWRGWLYDAFDGFFAAPRREGLEPYRETSRQRAEQYRDVMRALGGEASATVWSGDRNGLVLTVAVPVQRLKQVLGAVLLSRDGRDIDAAIRSVRLDILRVFAVALAVTILMSLYLGGAIVRPLRRLAAAAERVRRGHGRQSEIPDFSHRRDEIGDLSTSLRDMTGALWSRLDAIERFAADVAHEIKNPLTSVRSAVETAARIKDPERQRKLMAIIEDDVKRLDRLISDISDASRLDAELSRAELAPVDLGRMLDMLGELYAATAKDGAPRVVVERPKAPLVAPGIESRLVQVFRNLIANAVSFSPSGAAVTLRAKAEGGWIVATVEDEGPGVTPGKETTIFERFYSDRPSGEKFGSHSGLGLSISKQIVEAHGGTIRVENRRDADGRILGARFVVRLPRR